MPINYEAFWQQIRHNGKQFQAHFALREQRLGKAVELLDTLAEDAAFSDRLRQVTTDDPNERCAIPSDEAINGSFTAASKDNLKLTLLAADGSQINPDRHDFTSMGLINIAVIRYEMNSGTSPAILTETTLLDPEDFSSENNSLTEDEIALRRDVAEREFLTAEALKSEAGKPLIALTDGPLEIFTLRQAYAGQQQYIQRYQSTLTTMHEKQLLIAGYIDRPRANLVIRMIELAMSQQQGEAFSLAPTNDCLLFSDLLQPGERSAVFGLNSRSNRELDESLRFSFFYLNCGEAQRPQIARIEIPAWVAADPDAVELLHQVVLAQTKIAEGIPYPYILHRAHECAVVSQAEKARIQNLILRELAAQGAPIPGQSNKQRLKSLSGQKQRLK